MQVLRNSDRLCGLLVRVPVPTWVHYYYYYYYYYPSARCASAANLVGKDLDVFATGAVSLNDIYKHQPKSLNIVPSQS
jgi:hypothetical protein